MWYIKKTIFLRNLAVFYFFYEVNISDGGIPFQCYWWTVISNRFLLRSTQKKVVEHGAVFKDDYKMTPRACDTKIIDNSISSKLSSK